jgi:hypothetical protein
VGKAVVAQNAIRHGLLARQNVVMGEDPQEFDLHRRQMLDELRPANPVESTLAEQIVSLSWRLRRAGRLQNEVFDSLLAKELERSMGGFRDQLTARDEATLRSDPSSDPSFAVGRMITKDYLHASVLDRLQIYERRIESSLCKIMKELESRQRRRAEDYKTRRPTEVEGEPQIAGGTPATQPPAGPERVADCAKQSQSEEVSSLTCEVSSGDSVLQTSHFTPDTSLQTACGVTPNGACPPRAEDLSCKTNPISGD